MNKLKIKWKEILKIPIEVNKTFLQNGGCVTKCNKLMAYIHKTFQVNVTFEEIMESTLENQAKLILNKKKDPVKYLNCIEKRNPKTSVNPSLQQKALQNEFFYLLGSLFQ